MKLICEGEVNIYYVQTICLIFFPGEKFSESEITNEETPVLHVSLLEDESSATARAYIKIGGNGNSNSCTRLFTADNSIEKTRRNAVGSAVYSACRGLFRFTPSWGMLTGVRPSKIAASLIAEGKTPSEVRNYLKENYYVIPKKASLVTDIAVRESKIIAQLPPESCSVYISIPFCPTRCAYCSFVSYSTKRLLSMIPDYLVRLCSDIKRTFDLIKQSNKKVVTIYIGGGTPTILSSDQLNILLSCINECIDTKTVFEYTLEAGRPDTITEEKLKTASAYGINRVSINSQTLSNDVLASIGRHHTSEDFYKSYNIAKSSGIKYINTDIIVGLPGDNFATFSNTIDSIIKLRPDNITVHTFCVKKSADIINSDEAIYSRIGAEASKCVDYSQLRLKSEKFVPYYIYRQKNTVGNLENVGFARPGSEGLYNIFIMEEIHNIYAVGAGAVTKIVNRSESKINRFFMPKYPYEYLAMDTEHDIIPFYEKIMVNTDANTK